MDKLLKQLSLGGDFRRPSVGNAESPLDLSVVPSVELLSLGFFLTLLFFCQFYSFAKFLYLAI